MAQLAEIPEGKTLINTINAYSYNMAQKDEAFAEALKNGDYLIPDGMPIVKYCKWLKAKSRPKERIAGWDLFSFEMQKTYQASLKEASLNHESSMVSSKIKDQRSNLKPETLNLEPTVAIRPTVMFMGSSEKVLALIKARAEREYPNLEIVTYSPPYKPVFDEDDNKAIIKAINDANPDLLWIGMTAPKQEKWAYEHWDELNIHCHVGTIGAVFDFFAGTAERAPEIWQKNGFEWLYRLIKEPRRMWRRYILGNPEFFFRMLKEKF